MSTGPGSGPEGRMSNQIIRTPNNVRSAYENFLGYFRVAVEDAHAEVLPSDRPVDSCFTDSGSTTVDFKRCLYLRNLPCRKLSGSKRLDVLIMALEKIARNSWTLKSSTVHLNYIVVSNATALLAQSLHFDYVEGGQQDHPFFHVQLTDEPIPENDLRSTGFDLELNLPEQSTECWVTTKIPTPDMTLASVLYCLVADHLGAGIFSQFAQRVHSIQERLPPPSVDALKKSLQMSSDHLKSSHWFAHTHNPTQHNS